MRCSSIHHTKIAITDTMNNTMIFMPWSPLCRYRDPRCPAPCTPMNELQVKVLNRVLDVFEGKLTSKKWAALCKCSPDTALRDINELIALGVLTKAAAGGRSTAYELLS